MAGNQRISTWSEFIEKIVVPMSGIGVFIFAALGGPVPIPLYPLVAAAIGYPGFRALDRIRTNGK